MRKRLLTVGIGGTVATAFCCFTPLLPIVLTSVGLTGLLSVLYNDLILIPLLIGFIILTGISLWRQRKQK